MLNKKNNPRLAALLVLLGVVRDNLTLDHALAQQLPSIESPRDQALAQRLAYGVLRYLPALEHLSEQLLSKPLNEKHLDIQLCILLGIEQLWHMNLPPHAALHATVELAFMRKKPWAKGMLNAVLRRFQREQTECIERLQQNPTLQYACPEWLLERIKSDWPDGWEDIVQANLAAPPMWLRINLATTNRTDYLAELTQHEMAGSAGKGLSDVCLDTPCPVQQIPGFSSGMISIQDSAAQCAVPLLELATNQRVLDACAAPGGKTTQILENESALDTLVAVDIKSNRMRKVQENLQRLKLNCELITADVGNLDSWWDGIEYDRILLDAPCSATGVIRRHPDIKQRLQEKSITTLSALQLQLLEQLWLALRPGGILVYVTCSIFAQENQLVVQSFLDQHPDSRALPVHLPLGKACAPGWQILPGQDNTDGLFFARLQKNA